MNKNVKKIVDYFSGLFKGVPPIISLFLVVFVAGTTAMIFLWLILGFLDGVGYLRLVRSGLLLTGLSLIVWGGIRNLSGLIKIGVLLLVLGFVTSILQSSISHSPVEQTNSSTVSASSPQSEKHPNILDKTITKVMYGFTRNDWSRTGLSLFDLMIAAIIFSNAVWFHKKNWPAERFISANLAVLAFFVVMSFVVNSF